MEEMALGAKALGYKYFGFADHSQSLTIANGLSPERVRLQKQAVAELRKTVTGIQLFHGIECDVLADGSLDYDDETLALFDYVVASVHSFFNQTKDEMTARICRALKNPHVTMLGHATGRLLLKRDGYKVDLEKVLQTAAEMGTLIEINASPPRLDIDWIHAKRAKSLGVKLVINPDAHSVGEIELTRYGVDVARRGWLEKDDVFNTQSAAAVKKFFAEPAPDSRITSELVMIVLPMSIFRGQRPRAVSHEHESMFAIHCELKAEIEPLAEDEVTSSYRDLGGSPRHFRDLAVDGRGRTECATQKESASLRIQLVSKISRNSRAMSDQSTSIG